MIENKKTLVDTLVPAASIPPIKEETSTTAKVNVNDIVVDKPTPAITVPQVQQNQFQLKVDIGQLRRKSIFLAVPMYGGQCSGMFCRAVTDLSSICTRYGIGLQLYFLFNESLITRARNYCADEFVRSNCTHLMFIDSDIGFNPNDVIALLAMQSRFDKDLQDDGILRDSQNNVVMEKTQEGNIILDSNGQPKPVVICQPFVETVTPYDVIGAVYPKKSYDKDTPLLTEREGIKTIKWIVENKYAGKVWSFSEERGFEWQPVINWFKSFNPLKKWVKVHYQGGSGNGKYLILTNDHDCMFIDDIMKPVITKQNAEVGKGKWAVSNPKNRIMPLYNNEQISFLIGTILGDANISKKEKRLSIGHCKVQLDYLKLKQNIFGGNITGPYQTEKNGISYHLTTPINAQTRYLRDIIYIEGKKSVKNILQYIDEKALAFWIMDDGSLHNNNGTYSPYYRISTEGFSDEDQELLVSFFKTKWDIKASVVKNGDYKCLYINTIDSEKIFNMIAQYIPKSMEYKLPEKYRNVEKHVFNNERLKYGASLVTEVEWLDDNREEYDITVDINHNFVSKNITNFQCISWEKIKLAVDKGAADKNPNALENFVGDYVFNPKNGSGSIPIGLPAEVSELGTGFMMIRRPTLEKFKEAYPHKSYRPDHVRTEHFDGSREIMMYFQAEIDYGTTHYKDVSEQHGALAGTLFEKVVDAKASKRYLSEDYQFCYDLQRIGLKTWICPWMQLQHVGTYVFGGSLAALASVGAAATADQGVLNKYKNQK